jgi:oxygen-independent coproporphyrinogen-3 oxidase
MALNKASKDQLPISLYVHLPFCERMCFFCGCQVVAGKPRSILPRYIEALERELSMVRQALGPKKLVQLHLGGGTPTFLHPNDLTRLSKSVWSNFERTVEAEISLEIDPVVTTRAHLATARSNGFNRLSMGVQDFGEDVQEFIGRHQSEQRTVECFETARQLGFKSINVDLMYGLPGQTPRHLEYSARRIAELGADRVAIFGYAHVPWMRPHQKKLEIHGLPTTDARWEMAQIARTTLQQQGYVPIGMDHFALPEDELSRAVKARRLSRNFQGYTVLDSTHLVGIGMSAIGDVGDTYVQNSKRLSHYLERIESGTFSTERSKALSVEDRIRRAVITSLMCNLYVDFCQIEKEFGIDFNAHFGTNLTKLSQMQEDGLLTCHDKSIEIKDLGRPFLRNIAMVFDAYLEADPPKQRFSRVI